MKTKHTPGPWVLNHSAGFVWSQLHGKRVAEFDTETIKDHVEDQPERRANAKLIAAAPEMLHEHITDGILLKQVLDMLESGNTANAINHLHCILEAKERVIKKATA